MVSAMVSPSQRYTRRNPCPVCGGFDTMPRGQGVRCYGYGSADGRYAHCTREEYAGMLAQRSDGAYAHTLDGSCSCGVPHSATVPALRVVRQAGPANERKQPTWHRGPFPAEHKGGTYAGEWHYCDASALHVVYSVIRYNLPGGDKFFAQVRWRADARGGRLWTWGLGDTVRVLYRHAELLRSDPLDTVFVTEGERACEAVRSLGLTATTASGGAGHWDLTPSAREALSGRVVVILPDNDAKGEAHARQVAGDVLSVAKSVRILRLPGIPDKGDAVEWLAAGGTAVRLLQLALATPEERPAPVVPTPVPLPAVQPSLPSQPSAPVDPILLRQREAAMMREQAKRKELEAADAWRRKVQANQPLAASTRSIAIALRDLMAGGKFKPDEDGWRRLYMPDLADKAGMKQKTTGDAIQRLAECGALRRRVVFVESATLGQRVPRVEVQLTPLWQTPDQWAPPKARNHGGARTCRECGSTNVIAETVTKCTCQDCGVQWVEYGSRRQKPSHLFPNGNSRQDDAYSIYAVKMTAVSQREVSA